MEATESAMKSWDGAELFYRAWIPREPTDKAVLLFHRGHEHSGRWQQTVDLLGLKDIAVFAWDARGHGRSPGERGAANNFADVIRDVDAFARHISERHEIPIENMIVLAHSLAVVSVAAWVHDYAPPIRAMILATAAFHVKLYVKRSRSPSANETKTIRTGQGEELRQIEAPDWGPRASCSIRRRSAYIPANCG
jgi:alpha-beta hydrolase superfamily lysophospholipase